MSSLSSDLLLLHLAEDGQTLRLNLRAEDVGEHEAVFTFHSPVQDEDASRTRWLLEDYPRLKGRSSDPIASRIEQRLHILAGELREAVFDSVEESRPIREALADSRLVQRLRVLVEEPSTAAWIPWELILTPGRSEPLSILATSFTRRSSSEPPLPPTTASTTLRVLLVTCRPRGEEDVRFRSVASRIVQAVATSPQSAIRVDLLRPPTYRALRDALAWANSSGTPYDVVHFDGHGIYRADVLDPSQKRGYLLFEGLDGRGDEVPGSILGEDLAQEGVRWLLLNACRSAYAEPKATSEESPEITERAFGSLASEVQAAGVPGILAMGYNLYVVTAARLVADTYAALAAGWDLGEAVAHARRRLYHANRDRVSGAFDWLVPITFHHESMAGQHQPGAIQELSIQVSTTTPATAGVFDPKSEDGPRSASRPFFGYDEAILRLDRACTEARPAEIVGLSGSGKSAVVGEFSRWWVSTSSATAVIMDIETYSSFEAFEQELGKQLQAAQAYAPDSDCLVVLDGASNLLDAGNERWSTEDQARLRQWVEQQAASSDPVILTGRISSGLPGVETILLQGLDEESRLELAIHAGFQTGEASIAPGLLLWSQGNPVVVLQMPRIVEGVGLDAPGAARKLLWNLRSGKTDTPQQGIGLIERTGLEFFNVGRLRRAILPFVLSLFQGYVSDFEWQTFCQLVTNKGLKFASEANPIAVLKEELKAAERAGLACRTGSGYLLHPLAPIAIEPGFAGTMQAITGGNADLVRKVMGIAWASYIQSVSVARNIPDKLGSGGSSSALHLDRENLWNAIEIAVLGAWWGLALPLLHMLRDMLLAEAREQEWQEMLAEVFKRLRESPPNNEEMGPESAELQIIRLIAHEAERAGDEELVKNLRDYQLQIAYSEDVSLVVEKTNGEKEMDIDKIRRISALLKRGDVATREKSPESLAYYQEALRLAEETNDILRLGEVYLAIAKVHLNVPVLYDPGKYESYARQAIQAGRTLGPLGQDLVARGSLSLGNAILEEQRQLQAPDPNRLSEATEALALAATDQASGHNTRGSAHNGLGNLHYLENDLSAAADEYLEASKEFEAAGDSQSLLMAQTNAARVLTLCGRLEDARSLALQALDLLNQNLALAPQILPLLQKVLAATEKRSKD